MTSFDKQKSENNFVVNFKIEEIQEIRNDFLLYRKGYFFFYAIDTYDIISHFLPYTDGDLLTSSNKNIIAQRAVAYETFFTTFISNKLIVLDEYKEELLAAKSHIKRQIKNSNFLNKNIDKIKDEIEKIKESGAISKESFRQNIELILFLLILSENKNNVDTNFFTFLKDKLSIFNFDTNDEKRDLILEDVFNNSAPSKNVNKIYDKFFEQTVFYLSKLETDLERYTYLENSYRDIEVIDRINSVNSKLNHSYPEQKIFFVYLSSAPYKSREIISVFQKEKELFTQEKDKDYYSSYNFHRNIFQCFLFKVLAEEFPNVKDNTPLKILESLELLANHTKELSNKRQKPHSYLVNDDNLNILKKILDRYSSNIDNHFYFKIYNKYQALLDLTVSGISNEIVNILKDVHDYLKDESILKDGQDIFYNINQYKQTYFLSKLMDPSSSLSISIQFGKDIVRDSFHHLPYLLLINDQSLKEISRFIYPLFLNISEIASERSPNTSKINPLLNNLLSQISKDSKNITNLAVRFLVTTYLYLITTISENNKENNERKNKSKNNSNKELEVIEVLKKQKRMMENAAITFSNVDGEGRLEVIKKEISLSREFDYLILWLLRRNNLFTEAINFGNELVSTYNDGRFYHGLALSYISQAYSYLLDSTLPQNIAESSINFLNYGIIWMKRAKDSYIELISTLLDLNASILVKKNLLGTLNAIADTSIRKFSLLAPNNDEFLKDAKASIEEIKKNCKELRIDYSQLSIYNFTEAELIFYEALFLYKNGDLSNAYIKINEAKNRYVIANSGESSVHNQFKSIIENINALKSEIFIKKGSF